MGGNAESVYPIAKFHFAVSWSDATELICSEVGGLNYEFDVVEYRDGKSESFYKTKQPGLMKFGDVSLKKGVFKDDDNFRTWYEKVRDRDEYRDTVTIILKDENHEDVITWNLQNAWVSKFTQPDLNSTASEVSIEEITVVCENITQE
ncbi:MAG: phage tail protein [Saprospiraceae bacterium]|nr:phage tail protein [Saprospiraceae bacterium]